MTTEKFFELSVLHDAGTDESSPALTAFVKISRAIDALPVEPSQDFESLESAVFAEVESLSIRNAVFNIFGF